MIEDFLDEQIRQGMPFHEACLNGNFDIVKLFVKYPSYHWDVNETDVFGKTTLHLLIHHNWEDFEANEDLIVETFRFLLKVSKDIDINAKSDDGQPVLIYAYLHAKFEIVELLLQQTLIDINAEDENGMTLLHHALDRGDNEMVKRLKGKALNRKKFEKSKTSKKTKCLKQL